MSLTLSNFTNIVMEAIESIEKFLKRDFFELFYINDIKKIDLFYSNTINKNLTRLIANLLQRNNQYGVIFKNQVLNKSEIGIYWMIDLIDDKLNFINSISYWGITISLYSKSENQLSKVLFFMPITNDLYVCCKNEGLFLNNRKIVMSLSKTAVLLSNLTDYKFDDSLVSRVFGSETLSLFFRASSKVDKLYIKRTDYHELLAGLIIPEAKGVLKIEDEIIKI